MPAHHAEEEDKPCRACSDFKTWAKKQNKVTLSTSKHERNVSDSTPEDCPLDKADLGKATWGFLHSMAAYYPEKPTKAQASDMERFFNIFAQFYPCKPCAEDFSERIKKHPPKANSRQELEHWLCERHNEVNAKLGKPKFDCSKAHERWREGWSDGSCS